MKFFVLNPGVQPEMIQISEALKESNQEFIYFTAATYGYDHKFMNFLRNKLPGKANSFINRRICEIPDSNIRRSGTALEALYIITRNKYPVLARKILLLKHNYVDFICSIFILLRKHKVTLVSQSGTGILSLKASKIKGFRTILNCSIAHHGWMNLYLKDEEESNPRWSHLLQGNNLSNFRIKLLDHEINMSEIILVGSTFVKDTFVKSGINENKIKVIPLGSNIAKFYGTDAIERLNPRRAIDEPINIVMVGQLTQRKGLSYLIDALGLVNLPLGSQLLLVGAETMGPVSNLINNPSVKLLGHKNRSEISEILEHADLFILPSLVEGFPLAAIEAFAFGVPVCVTSNSFGEDVISSFENGFVIPPRDSLAIAEILRFAISEPKLLHQIGLKGKIRSNLFTWEEYKLNINHFLIELTY